MHEDAIRSEFTHQSRTFNVAPAMRSAETLQALIDAMPTAPGQRWLDVACGPGLVARALAPRVGSVLGVDLTGAMIDLARREARREGLANVAFALGDATRLDLPDDSFDGAVTRFSLHHIPLPSRTVAEMARVVRPGGSVVLADHLHAEDHDGAVWQEEIERLRDPSHWACLTHRRIQELGRPAGLELEAERVIPFAMSFEEWLSRGSGGPGASELIERALAARPGGSEAYRVEPGRDGGRRLHLRYSLTLWRKR
ncbi:MAG TPA: class I SAM-dependent methyltransferase [Chloroflexota bacterium]|jgi:SAM-dependent methyltransferase|nr:class I SAM-dependent methyltransferase [Chloroflexota bacterium]